MNAGVERCQATRVQQMLMYFREIIVLASPVRNSLCLVLPLLNNFHGHMAQLQIDSATAT